LYTIHTTIIIVTTKSYGVNSELHSIPTRRSSDLNQNTQNKQQPQKQQQPKETETTAVNVPQGFSQNDIKLMANAVYGEARGEPYIGKVAVAAVILNRVKSDTFPNTISGVIF